ncbi:MAG: hypothetical protein AAF296_14180 [Pseudomonadota bacterium]
MTRDVDYQIFAAAPRVSERAMQQLRNAPNLTLIDAPATPERVSREHAYYLDILAAAALQAGASAIATFDMDSFPIRPNWASSLMEQLTLETPLAAILRSENGDTVIPHPSGLICRADFIEDHHPRFFPDDIEERDQAWLISQAQRLDTGVGYALALKSAGKDWIKLHRTNRHDFHPVLAGVYSDLVFHLGAAGRPPVFYADFLNEADGEALYNARKDPGSKEAFQARSKVIAARNKLILDDITAALKTDPQAFFDQLTGNPNTKS